MEEDELNDYFNEAAEARQEEPQVSPGISAAHEHDPSGLDGTALGNAPLVGPDFNQAANDAVDRDFEPEQEQVDHAPAPEMNGPTPPGSTRDAQDRITFEDNQQAVHDATGNDDLYEEYYDDEDLEIGQDDNENDSLNDGKENGGLDDDMDQN